MQAYLDRQLGQKIVKSLENYPVTAILGPRQCGKSTLAKAIITKLPKAIYLDLEKPSDLRKLENPEFYFSNHKDKLICLDEIQLYPHLFSLLRSVVDETGQNGQFLLLGSASRDLIQHSSQSLAGRISLLELTPFLISELTKEKIYYQSLWERGGYPKSLLAKNLEQSYKWRENFIKTFLERDIPQLGFKIPSQSISRLWRMLAHHHGQTVNLSQFGNSMGLSHTTIRTYIDLLEQTFMIRTIPAYETSLKKRLVKSPKVYIRDSGILQTLLEIENFEALVGHPVFGASWEGFCLEQILNEMSDWRYYHYRTSSQNEVDLILEKSKNTQLIEFKTSKAPKLSKGFWTIHKELKPNVSWVICPVEDSYEIQKNVFVGNLKHYLQSKIN